MPQIFDDIDITKDFEVGTVQIGIEEVPQKSNDNEDVNTGDFEVRTVQKDQTGLSLEAEVIKTVQNNQSSVTMNHQESPPLIRSKNPTLDRLNPREAIKIANYRESFFV